MREITCRFGHMCTSGCGNDFDCPCVADHCCAISVEQGACDGTCDDCFSKVEEIPMFKGTMEKLNNLTIVKND